MEQVFCAQFVRAGGNAVEPELFSRRLIGRLGAKRLNRNNTTMMMMKIAKSGKSSNGLTDIALISNCTLRIFCPYGES